MYFPDAEEPVSPDEYRDEQLLGSALGRPFHTAFGEAAYLRVCDKAAALFHSLIANHPFANGNKRTAVVALDLFLYANNRLLYLDQNEMYALAKSAASYRERLVSHQTCFSEIRAAVIGGSINFNAIRAHRHVHASCLETKAFVRRHPLNRAQDCATALNR